MTGAMYSAIAGLKTHMSALNVIGNNIANVNTYGYKASRYTFDESLYTTSRSGSNGTTTMGGRNPAQIGYGCSIGTIDTDMSTKTYNPTGYGLDTMIDGEGFFLLGNKNSSGIKTQDQLQGMKLSRLGNIDFKDGYLVDGDGNVVYGFPAISSNTVDEDDNETQGGTGTAITEGSEGKMYSFEKGSVLAPLRYPKISEDGTVCYPMVSDDGTLVYPDLYITTNDAGQKQITYYYDGISDPDTIPEGDNVETLLSANMEWPVLSSVAIDEKSGRISGMSDDVVVVIGHLALAKVDNPNGVTHTDGRYYQALDGAGDVHVTVLDESLTHPAYTGNGNAAGAAAGTDANGDGYRANFAIESAGGTGIVTGGLEQSGTDLATEISNMIMMQRGYQANTRIVTVTDSMLEELVNMKR